MGLNKFLTRLKYAYYIRSVYLFSIYYFSDQYTSLSNAITYITNYNNM